MRISRDACLTLGTIILAVVCFLRRDDADIQFQAFLDMRFGEVVPVSTLNEQPVEKICILFPYQEKLHGEDSTSEKVNAFLRAKHYVSDEGRWSLVWVGHEAVSISEFDVSGKLDVLAPHGLKSAKPQYLPDGFKPTECSDSERASLVKVRAGDRTYVIFGEED